MPVTMLMTVESARNAQYASALATLFCCEILFQRHGKLKADIWRWRNLQTGVHCKGDSESVCCFKKKKNSFEEVFAKMPHHLKPSRGSVRLI